MKIVPLGARCRLCYDLREKVEINQPTGLFDWMWTDDFEDILHVFKMLINEEELKVTKSGNDLFIVGTKIKTIHFRLELFPGILARRGTRFLEIIKTSKHILFIRDEEDSPRMTTNHWEKFLKLAEFINPDLKCKLLLFSDGSCPLSIPYNGDTENYKRLVEDLSKNW